MMGDLDARDIGHLLICNLDYPIAVRAGTDLARSQTQMQGASCCDFRYRRRALIDSHWSGSPYSALMASSDIQTQHSKAAWQFTWLGR